MAFAGTPKGDFWWWVVIPQPEAMRISRPTEKNYGTVEMGCPFLLGLEGGGGYGQVDDCWETGGMMVESENPFSGQLQKIKTSGFPLRSVWSKHGWNPPVPSVHLAPFGAAKVEVPTSHTGQRLERIQKMASPPNNCQRWQRIMTMLYYITYTILLHFIYVRRYFRFPRDWLKHAN